MNLMSKNHNEIFPLKNHNNYDYFVSLEKSECGF